MEHVSQACLFLEDAGDLGQALNRDVDDMSMDEQVRLALKTSQCPALLETKARTPQCCSKNLRACCVYGRHSGSGLC